MNTLSWFIYLAAMLPVLQVMLGIAAAIGAVAAIILFVGGADSYDDPRRVYFRWGRRTLYVVAAITVLAVLIPQERTMYLIAGSQIGETVVATPEAKEVLELVKKRLIDYLKVD